MNYAGLGVEEFGSVYELLLDYHPHVTCDPPCFALVAGSERKATGTYYTPPSLVQELIRSALIPIIEERLATAQRMQMRMASGGRSPCRPCDPIATWKS